MPLFEVNDDAIRLRVFLSPSLSDVTKSNEI